MTPKKKNNVLKLLISCQNFSLSWLMVGMLMSVVLSRTVCLLHFTGPDFIIKIPFILFCNGTKTSTIKTFAF